MLSVMYIKVSCGISVGYSFFNKLALSIRVYSKYDSTLSKSKGGW